MYVLMLLETNEKYKRDIISISMLYSQMTVVDNLTKNRYMEILFIF